MNLMSSGCEPILSDAPHAQRRRRWKAHRKDAKTRREKVTGGGRRDAQSLCGSSSSEAALSGAVSDF
jgi:hypothetical protein